MTQDAVVMKAFDNGLAEVEVERNTACGECANREVCHYTDKIRTFARNTIGAKEGEPVIIQSKSGEIIGAAFILYIIPLIALLAGYLVAARLGAAEGRSILAAFAAFGVTVLIVTLYQRARAKKKQIEFEIVSFRLNE